MSALPLRSPILRAVAWGFSPVVAGGFIAWHLSAPPEGHPGRLPYALYFTAVCLICGGLWTRQELRRRAAPAPPDPFPHVKFDRNGTSYVEPADILWSEGYRRQAEAARRHMERERRRDSMGDESPAYTSRHTVALSERGFLRVNAPRRHRRGEGL